MDRNSSRPAEMFVTTESGRSGGINILRQVPNFMAFIYNDPV